MINAGSAAEDAKKEVDILNAEMKKTGEQKLTEGIEKLTAGIKNPKGGFKSLTDTAKKFAKEKLDKEINALPPKLQLGVKAGGLLLAVLGKVTKLTFHGPVSGLKSLADHAASAAKSLPGASLKAVGKGTLIGITAASTALAGGAVAAFNFGSAYETSLAKVSTMVDTSVKSVAELSSDVMNLSNKTGEGAAGLNEAVYQALSAGADTADVVDLVDVAVKAARGGFTDTTTAVDGLTSTLNAFGMQTRDAEGLANSFLITQNKGKTTFGELASSIGSVAPTASAAGVGVNELLAGVASLTANGIGTSEAMTGIKAAMSNVIKPSAEASKVAQSLGLDFSTAALQSKGLAGFLDDVKTATGGNMDTMAQLFGSVEALNTVLTLTSDNGMSLMQDTMNEMATNTKALDAAYEAMSDTAQVSVQKGLNSFKNLGIGIYQSSEGPVAELTGLFANSGQELFKAFESGGMSGLSAQIGTTLTNALITLTGYLPELIQGGVSVVQSLISGIMQNRGQITQSVLGGITTMLMGILQIAPQILTAGVVLLASLLQGLDQQMPGILTAGLAAIQNLCAGLMANGPTIIQSGISLIMQLINGLVAAAPVILTTGVQLIAMLIQGFAGALPGLIGAAGQLAGEIIRAILSINWLKLGLDIIVGIGSGLVNGIKGLFGKGKDAGKEVGDGVTEGLNQSTAGITSAADQASNTAANSLQPDTVKLSAYGVQTVSAYDAGLQGAAPMLLNTASGISGDAAMQFADMGLSQSGYENAISLSQGLMSGSGQVVGAAQSIGIQAADAAQTDVLIGVSAESSGIAQFEAQTQQLVSESQTSLGQLPDVFTQAFTAATNIVSTEMTDMSCQMKAGFAGMLSGARSFATNLKGVFAGINLRQAGVNIISGLNQGMLSMRPALMATASGLAKDVSTEINRSLDIHSPSRVTEKSGENTDLGLVKGMNNLSGKVKSTASGIGDITAKNISPMTSRYSPESSGTSTTSNNSQVNNYSPQFHLTLNGASASDSNERKVKRWVKDAWKENLESMGRQNPRLLEV